MAPKKAEGSNPDGKSERDQDVKKKRKRGKEPAVKKKIWGKEPAVKKKIWGKEPAVKKKSGKEPEVKKSGKEPEVKKSGKELEVKKKSGKELEVKKKSGKEPEVKKKSGKEPEVKKKSGKEPEVKKKIWGKEPAVKTKSGKEPEVVTKSGKEPEVVTKSGKEPEVKTKSGKEPEVKTKSGKEPEVKTKSGKEPEVKTKSGKEPEVKTKSGKEPEVKTKSGKEPEVKTKSGKEPEVKTKSGKEPEVKTKSGKEPEVKAKMEKGPEVKAKMKKGPEVAKKRIRAIEPEAASPTSPPQSSLHEMPGKTTEAVEPAESRDPTGPEETIEPKEPGEMTEASKPAEPKEPGETKKPQERGDTVESTEPEEGKAISVYGKRIKDQEGEKKLKRGKAQEVKKKRKNEKVCGMKMRAKWVKAPGAKETRRVKAPGVQKKLKGRLMLEPLRCWQEMSGATTESAEPCSTTETSGSRDTLVTTEPLCISWDDQYGMQEEEEDYYYFIIEEAKRGKKLPSQICWDELFRETTAPRDPWELREPMEPWKRRSLTEPHEISEPTDLEETTESTDLETTEPADLQETTEPMDLEETTEPADLQETTEPMEPKGLEAFSFDEKSETGEEFAKKPKMLKAQEAEKKPKSDEEVEKGKWKGKLPNTTVKRGATLLLPAFCVRFLWSESREFFFTKLFLGGGLGGFIGIALYFFIIDPMALYEDHKIKLLYGIFGTCVIGWAFSPLFRCACLLIVPQVLGKEGRAYLMIFVVATIYAGPVKNLQNNLDDVVNSIGCTVELQINHTKLIWKVMVAPLKKVIGNLVSGGKEFNAETAKIPPSFVPIQQEVMSRAGFNTTKEKAVEKKEMQVTKNETVSTQRKFEIKTMMRCETLAEEAIFRCVEWFDMKHKRCMEVIWLPILNHLLCLPMTFKFLCQLANLMTVWCKAKIPVEGNFGKTFDTVNKTVGNLSEAFEADMSVKTEEQSTLVGANITTTKITDQIKVNVSGKKILLNKVLTVVQVVLSCTFVFLFISAFSYANSFNSDIRFDNIYVTLYFKQIDARRKKKNKRTLLPMRKGEATGYIFPFSPAIQGPEMETMMKELMQCIPMAAFLIAVCIIDYLLTEIFTIIRKHSFIEYTFKSAHHLEVIVQGDTLMARLLRSTIGALNTSSNTVLESNNTRCVPDPVAMKPTDYLWAWLPLVGVMVLCVFQVYVYRTRRVVASFYYPKREKRRVLFMYNELLRKRVSYVDSQRKRIMRRARMSKLLAAGFVGSLYRCCPCLRRCLRRRCMVCEASETKTSVVCENPDCGTVYCPQCWRDMKKFCFACMPYKDFVSGDSDSEHDVHYGE